MVHGLEKLADFAPVAAANFVRSRILDLVPHQPQLDLDLSLPREPRVEQREGGRRIHSRRGLRGIPEQTDRSRQGPLRLGDVGKHIAHQEDRILLSLDHHRRTGGERRAQFQPAVQQHRLPLAGPAAIRAIFGEAQRGRADQLQPGVPRALDLTAELRQQPVELQRQLVNERARLDRQGFHIADPQALRPPGRDRKDARPVDIPRLALDDARIDHLPLDRLVSMPRPLLFHRHRLAQRAVHLERVTGNRRARRQGQHEFTLEHPPRVIAEKQFNLGARRAADQPDAHRRLLHPQRFPGATRRHPRALPVSEKHRG